MGKRLLSSLDMDWYMYWDEVVKATFLAPSPPLPVFPSSSGLTLPANKNELKRLSIFFRDHVALYINMFWANLSKCHFFFKKLASYLELTYLMFRVFIMKNMILSCCFFTFCINWKRIIWYSHVARHWNFYTLSNWGFKKTYVHRQPKSITTFEDYFKLSIYIKRDFRIFLIVIKFAKEYIDLSS